MENYEPQYIPNPAPENVSETTSLDASELESIDRPPRHESAEYRNNLTRALEDFADPDFSDEKCKELYGVPKDFLFEKISNDLRMRECARLRPSIPTGSGNDKCPRRFRVLGMSLSPQLDISRTLLAHPKGPRTAKFFENPRFSTLADSLLSYTGEVSLS